MPESWVKSGIDSNQGGGEESDSMGQGVIVEEARAGATQCEESWITDRS